MNDVQVYIAVSNIITKWCLNCKDYECTKHLSDKQKSLREKTTVLIGWYHRVNLLDVKNLEYHLEVGYTCFKERRVEDI